MNSKKSQKCAIVIAPPLGLCRKIQEIRKKHDRAYERWMPHINLVYPFYEDQNGVFERESQKLTKQLSRVQPFKISFTKDSFGFFRQRRRTVVWVRPLMTAASDCLTLPSAPSLIEPGPPPPNVKPAKITKEPRKAPPQKPKKATVLPPKSIPRQADRDPVVTTKVKVIEQQQTTLIGYPEPVPQHVKLTAPATGLDALVHAMWTPEETSRQISSARARQADAKVGFDALRFAFCGGLNAGDRSTAHASLSMSKRKRGDAMDDDNRYLTYTKVLSDVTEQQKDALRQTFVEISEEDIEAFDDYSDASFSSSSGDSEDGDTSSTSHGSTSDDNVDDALEPLDTSVMDSPGGGGRGGAHALPPRDDGHHPHVMQLQQELEAVYPDLDDLSSHSAAGFQPHLTLGQCDNFTADEFIANLKREFVDFSFEVNCIQLISRAGFLDPFKIRIAVPLGAVIGI